MISKRIDRKKNSAGNQSSGSFTKLAQYIVATKHPERCTHMWAVNCLSSPKEFSVDLPMIVTEIGVTQYRYTGRGKDMTYHMMLSFPKGERPSFG